MQDLRDWRDSAGTGSDQLSLLFVVLLFFYWAVFKIVMKHICELNKRTVFHFWWQLWWRTVKVLEIDAARFAAHLSLWCLLSMLKQTRVQLLGFFNSYDGFLKPATREVEQIDYFCQTESSVSRLKHERRFLSGDQRTQTPSYSSDTRTCWLMVKCW